MYKVGITGGIGSGKSTVCDILREFDVAVYNSDVRAKELMMESVSLRQALVERFGEDVYNAEGLNRAYLASKVFGKAALTWNTKFFREFCFNAGYRFDFHWYINQAR
jgi:dephospho-CoA kinase